MCHSRYIFLSFALLIGITTAATAADPCKKYLNANDLTSSKKGEKHTALYCYNQMLAKDANNLTALAGLKEIEARYVKWAKRALKRGQKTKVERYLNSLRLVNPNSQALAELEAQAYPNRQPIASAAPSNPPIAEKAATPPESVTPPAETKSAKIIDIGQIYAAINTTECLTWPSSKAKQKGGKNGWGSFYPKVGDIGNVVSEMKHCHLEDKVYLLNINQYYVPISSTGVEVVE